MSIEDLNLHDEKFEEGVQNDEEYQDSLQNENWRGLGNDPKHAKNKLKLCVKVEITCLVFLVIKRFHNIMNLNEGTAEDLWTPFKELIAVVECYLTNESDKASYAVHTFESVLRRHKQTFLSLLKNPAKNPGSREEIKHGISEGVNLPSIGRTLLSKELVDEAIILSDMYNANEFACLELLHTAQQQSSRHPGLARGLLAVILYYDGRRALIQALRELVMAREGVSWSINVREEIVSYVSRYVDQLIADGLLGSVLDSIRCFTLDNELDLLRRNRALPPRRHHVRLVATITTTRKLLAGEMCSAKRGPSGALDETSLALQMALLYALDLSVLHRRDDGEELAKKLPLIYDADLISVLVDELSPGTPHEGKGGGLRALCQLALGLALSALKRAPVLRRGAEAKSELLDQDEVFEYLDEAILSSDVIANEEYYQRRIHSLITDFIVLMHSKLMEMRVKCGSRAASLYKFVRLSGALVAPTLLGSYLRALAALAVPRHTWALLARRDALSAHHLLTALALYHRSDLLSRAAAAEGGAVYDVGRTGWYGGNCAASVECRIEQYPLSISFLKLLESLCASAPLPRTLGAGAREPGLDPYVEHVMMSLCFRLFVLWLDQYEPSPADFPPTNQDPDSNPPPGFRILMSMHTKSELLRLVFSMLDETYELMERQPMPEQGAPRDRLLTVCRLAGVCGSVPAAAARAVALLSRALLHPACARHLLAARHLPPHHALPLRHAFVECLETEESCCGEEGVADIRAAKEGVLQLLLQLLPSAPPNFAHFLLGYQLHDD
ncbi:unnamed protein product, partial [Leptidea sinapis]